MMDFVTPFVPTPGSAKPGNLYADLGTKTLWLGVDPAVDAAQAVLISDIVGLQANINQCLVDAKAYTDTKIATRAPTVHNHTSSQITDFNAAVTAVATSIPQLNWVAGMIMQWSGSLASIGVGSLAGWALCDGANGTPDLRDRFLIGAGNKPVGQKNPLATIDTSDDGAHTPVVGATSLTVAQMPAHTHPVTVAGTGTGGTDVQGNHSHSYTTSTFTIDSSNGGNRCGPAQSLATSVAGAHSHNVSVNVDASGTAASQGSGAGHAHTASAVAAHHHTLTSNQVRDVLPYYALAFIMKL